MHLVKWIRKNMHRIMVFVIIFIMLAFVVGQFGLKMIVGLMGGGSQVIATYQDGEKIKSQNFIQAQNELAVLRMLMADRLLLAQSGGSFSAPLLAYLLFTDSQFTGQIPAQMKQAVQRGQLRVSIDELETFFQQRRQRPEILWILLKNEAYRAGCVLPNDTAAKTLRYVIPQMTNNQIDGAALVNQIINKNNLSEDQILRIYSDLLSVLLYADNVMDNQAVTIDQIKAAVGRSKERVDADYVDISAEQLIDEDSQVTDAQIQQQFDAYKAEIPGNPSDDNPFGFGYKLPKRIQLEYMIVLMEDVTKQIETPTPEALEAYYSNNIEQFQIQVPSDPNDPESEKITQTKTFAESQAQIRRALEEEKTTTLANMLFNEIKDKTEAGFETVNFDEASVAQLQQAAGDFQTVGTTLAEKFEIPIVTGKTGWLDPETLAKDDILSSMAMRRGQNFLRLSDLAFAVTEGKEVRQRIGVPSIRTWENIGPLMGGIYSEEQEKYFRAMALIRVTGIKEAQVAENADVEFKTQGVVLMPEQSQQEDTYSLKETIADDIRLMNAMNAANGRATELVAWINDKGWDDAITAYNDKYAAADPNDPDNQRIELTEIKQQLRVSQAEIELAKRVMLQNPASAQFIQRELINGILTNQLYGLLDEDAESTGTIQTVLPFEPQRACIVVKEVKRQPATMKDYIDSKAQTSLQLNAESMPSLALKHFNNENIAKRMNYKPKQEEKPEDEQDPTNPEDSEDQ